MSYDIWIGDFEANYTSNVSAVFYDHIPDGLYSFVGLTGKQCGPILAEAWKNLNTTRHNLWSENSVGEPRMSDKYDAESGWGSLIGALIFLGQFTAACGQNPRNKVGLSA